MSPGLLVFLFIAAAVIGSVVVLFLGRAILLIGLELVSKVIRRLVGNRSSG